MCLVQTSLTHSLITPLIFTEREKKLQNLDDKAIRDILGDEDKEDNKNNDSEAKTKKAKKKVELRLAQERKAANRQSNGKKSKDKADDDEDDDEDLTAFAKGSRPSKAKKQ